MVRSWMGSRPGLARRAVALCVALLCVAWLVACGGSKGGPATASTATTASTTSSAGTAATAGADKGAASGTTGAVAPTPSHAVSERVVTASSGAVTATMNAAGHHPRVNAPWPIRFSVNNKGNPAKAAVEYEYLFGGQVVAHRSHYHFTGTFRDTFRWPASAVGYPLTFRAVITSNNLKLNLDYPVQVRN